MTDYKLVRAFCLTIAALCIVGVATAATGTATLSFTRPTMYSDGTTPLPASAITGYAVDCTFTPTGGVAAPCTLTGSPIAGSAQTGNVTLTYPATGGNACFVLRTLVGTLSSNGSSPPACKSLAALTPGDPTNVTVTITLALNLTSATPITVAMAAPVVTTK